MFTDYTGARLRLYRLMAGLTIEDCCKLFDISNRTWRYWETPECQKPIPAPILDWFDQRLDTICSLQEQVSEVIEELEQVGAVEPGDEHLLTLYRSQEALDRAHPDFPGGVHAHNQMQAFSALHVMMHGYEPRGVYDNDPRAHVDYSEADEA